MFGNTVVIGKVAGVVSLAGFLPYIMAMVQGKTTPQRTTWFIWAAVGGVLFASYYAGGARDSIWIPVGSFVGPLLIWFFSFKYGEGGWELLDKFYLGI